MYLLYGTTVYRTYTIKYNTWFEDTRYAIIKEEGPGYNEYLRSMFRAYISREDEEFLDAIKDEQRKWIQGKLSTKYTYCDLMDLGHVTFNNLINPSEICSEKNYLALATALMTKMSTISEKKQDRSNSNGKGSERTYQEWRFQNTDNKETKEVRDSTMKWCTNNCHPKPMWCGRKKCLNIVDYS